MPSIVDRGPDGIVYRAGRNLPLIDLDLLTLLFGMFATPCLIMLKMLKIRRSDNSLPTRLTTQPGSR